MVQASSPVWREISNGWGSDIWRLLSVTPFSPTALDRGIDAVVVSAARVLQGHRDDGLSQERSAWRVRDEQGTLSLLVERLESRIRSAAQLDDLTAQARLRLANRVDQWNARAGYAQKCGQTLVYERTRNNGAYLPLLTSPEHAKAHVDLKDRAPFVVPHSMREVQPDINLLVSPLPQRLYVVEPDDAPGWRLPADEELT